ncbi:sulfurtransferase complex subunit TusB [Candidatus Providencia siddallii]|uniref:Protein TusB n=1 Tax=Candidatus Providencia siddallii TaxID=1715285 RepID=A0ABM9NNK3_9GAMM
MLYTLSRSPYYCDFSSILRLINKDDSILLFQDGVIAGISKTNFFLALQKTCAKIYALNEDVNARGLQKKISKKIFFISYIDFVKLTEIHEQQFAF